MTSRDTIHPFRHAALCTQACTGLCRNVWAPHQHYEAASGGVIRTLLRKLLMSRCRAIHPFRHAALCTQACTGLCRNVWAPHQHYEAASGGVIRTLLRKLLMSRCRAIHPFRHAALCTQTCTGLCRNVWAPLVAYVKFARGGRCLADSREKERIYLWLRDIDHR